jgi:hypothetical protein
MIIPIIHSFRKLGLYSESTILWGLVGTDMKEEFGGEFEQDLFGFLSWDFQLEPGDNGTR